MNVMVMEIYLCDYFCRCCRRGNRQQQQQQQVSTVADLDIVQVKVSYAIQYNTTIATTVYSCRLKISPVIFIVIVSVISNGNNCNVVVIATSTLFFDNLNKNKIMDDSVIINQTIVFNSTNLSVSTVWADPTVAIADDNRTGSVTDVVVTDQDVIVAITGTGSDGHESCGEWEPAQHNLFQLSNICFAAAFCIPRSLKPSLLLLRTLLCLGFFVSAIWAGVHICSPDILAWNVVLSITNLIHSVILTCRFLPPSLSVELTELYDRLFKPLKVTKKHFKELSREASMCFLTRGENYAIEESTPADERLSILLKGKLRVSCDNMHLHYINSHQFIDSPEWEASHETSDELFQVTITAEEDCVYLCWPKLRLDRVLRHRPMLQTVLSNLIGKDITQKLYSLNEHLGNTIAIADLSKSKHMSDHWRHVMTRSVSVDAVDTGTRGHVRSQAWKTTQKYERRNSDTEPPSRGQQCWIPVVANHFPPTSPFAAASNQSQQQSSSSTFHPPPPPPCLPSAAASAAQTATAQQPPLALIPVIVPLIAPPAATTSVTTVALARPNRPRNREVKFEDSKV